MSRRKRHKVSLAGTLCASLTEAREGGGGVLGWDVRMGVYLLYVLVHRSSLRGLQYINQPPRENVKTKMTCPIPLVVSLCSFFFFFLGGGG
jgi:hypothetical protein